MESYIICLVTLDTYENAVKIASILVEEKIAACANIVSPIRSIYRWQGKICDENEILMMMKTRHSLFERLKNRVKELHPYDVPEIISVKISEGLSEYLRWINDSTEVSS
ncbi:MAG: divalent-cation tolerance protein CutA [Deltaproteobacteria bacterium]|jgi:periplasmic divalent cation tolerance protein|nr:divalent-cation tolerance protein CutA [Deltaproteobacteria bacterium]